MEFYVADLPKAQSYRWDINDVEQAAKQQLLATCAFTGFGCNQSTLVHIMEEEIDLNVEPRMREMRQRTITIRKYTLDNIDRLLQELIEAGFLSKTTMTIDELERKANAFMKQKEELYRSHVCANHPNPTTGCTSPRCNKKPNF